VQELGGSTAKQTARLDNENIPYHKCHTQFINGGVEGEKAISFLVFWEFESSVVRKFKLFEEFRLFEEFNEIRENLEGL